MSISSFQRRKAKSLLKQILFFSIVGSIFILVLLKIAESGKREPITGDQLYRVKNYLEETGKLAKYISDSGRNRRIYSKRILNLVTRIANALNLEKTAKKSRGADGEETSEFGNLVSLCPEEFMGTLEGHPLYEIGFDVQDCEYAQPVGELVTVVANLASTNQDPALDLLQEFHSLYPKVSIRVAVDEDKDEEDVKEMEEVHPLAVIDHFPAAMLDRPGSVWNTLIEGAKTPYVFVLAGGGVNKIGVDLNLARLIRAIELLKVDVVGTAIRYEDGRWNLNCYQSHMRNYSLWFDPGYIYSSHECLYCSHFDGPFLARAELFQKRPFDEYLRNYVELDLHLRAPKTNLSSSAVCPDVMSHITLKKESPEDNTQKGNNLRKTNRQTSSPSASALLPLARKFSFFKIRLPSGSFHQFSGEDLGRYCQLYNGMALTPDCIGELQKALQFIFSACIATNSMCQLQEGSLLGAVKLGGLLPWERDADIMVLSDHFGKLLLELSKREKEGPGSLELREQSSCPSEADTCSGGVALLTTQAWTIEINGQSEVQEQGVENFNQSTKISMNGYWYPTSRNPGLHARNRYGNDIYQHVEHWMTLGKHDGWQPYLASGRFSACPRPGFHGCLDQFRTDGNMQFQKDLMC